MPPPAVVLAALLQLCVAPLAAGVAARRCFPGIYGVVIVPRSDWASTQFPAVLGAAGGEGDGTALLPTYAKPLNLSSLESMHVGECLRCPTDGADSTGVPWHYSCPARPPTGVARPPRLHPRTCVGTCNSVERGGLGLRPGHKCVASLRPCLFPCRSCGAGGGQPRPAAKLRGHRRSGGDRMARHQPGPGGAGCPPCAAADAAAGEDWDVDAAHSGPT